MSSEKCRHCGKSSIIGVAQRTKTAICPHCNKPMFDVVNPNIDYAAMTKAPATTFSPEPPSDAEKKKPERYFTSKRILESARGIVEAIATITGPTPIKIPLPPISSIFITMPSTTSHQPGHYFSPTLPIIHSAHSCISFLRTDMLSCEQASLAQPLEGCCKEIERVHVRAVECGSHFKALHEIAEKAHEKEWEALEQIYTQTYQRYLELWQAMCRKDPKTEEEHKKRERLRTFLDAVKTFADAAGKFLDELNP